MNKMLLPIFNDDGMNSKLSEHFGHAPFFAIYDISKKDLIIVKNEINHNDVSKSAIHQIKDIFNPVIIFAKNIGRKAIDNAHELNIKVLSGNYNVISEVIDNLYNLNDDLTSCEYKH